jgi:hypothetical protein
MTLEKDCINLYKHADQVDINTSALMLAARMTERLIAPHTAEQYRRVNFNYMQLIDKLLQIKNLQERKADYDAKAFDAKLEELHNGYFYYIHRFTKELYSILPY